MKKEEQHVERLHGVQVPRQAPSEGEAEFAKVTAVIQEHHEKHGKQPKVIHISQATADKIASLYERTWQDANPAGEIKVFGVRCQIVDGDKEPEAAD